MRMAWGGLTWRRIFDMDGQGRDVGGTDGRPCRLICSASNKRRPQREIYVKKYTNTVQIPEVNSPRTNKEPPPVTPTFLCALPECYHKSSAHPSPVHHTQD